MSKNKSGKDAMRRSAGGAITDVRMLRAGKFSKAVLYVEGDNDVSFFSCIVDTSFVTFEPMDGKPSVLEAIAHHNKKKTKGVLAIVDSDFDHILARVPYENVIRTDTHDIETLMLREGVFRFAVHNYYDEKKAEQHGYDLDRIKKEIFEIGCLIGKLRLLSEKENLCLGFKEVEKDLGKLVKFGKENVEFDFHQYVYECISSSRNSELEVGSIYKRVLNDSTSYDIWQICRGHDLTRLISLFFSREIFGKHFVNKEEIETVLMSAYLAGRYFKKTTMYIDLKEWQRDHKSFKILNNEYIR